MRVNKIRRSAKVPGLKFVSSLIGSYRYLEILHEQSDKPLIRFTSHPVKNVSEVIRIAEMVLAIADWTMTEAQLTEAHSGAVIVLKQYVYVEQGYYITKRKPA
jgi:hypothetical protein